MWGWCIFLMVPSMVSAFTVSFSQQQFNAGLGSSQTNQSFTLGVTIENTDGLFSPSTGFKDFIIYFNDSDITSWFISNLKITSINNTQLSAAVAVPSGLLPQGVYFLSAGVRDVTDSIATGNSILVIGNPKIVSPPAGNVQTLRQLVENGSNLYIHIPGGLYNFDDSTILQLKNGQVLYGDGPNDTILDGSRLATSGLSPVLVLGNHTQISSLGIQNTATGSGISLNGQVSALVNNVFSTQNKGGGAVASGGAALSIINSFLYNNQYDGATIENGSHGLIVMTTAWNNVIDGLGANTTASLSVDFCESYENSGVGTGYFSQSSGSVTRSFLHHNQKACLFVGQGSAVQNISNNRISFGGSDGIGLDGQGSTVNVISSNVIEGNVSGLTVNDSGAVQQMQQNTFSGNTNTNLSVIAGGVVTGSQNSYTGSNIGIGIGGANSKITLTSDTVTASQQYGVMLEQTASATLTTLNVSSNNLNGISVGSGSKLTGSSLIISGNKGFGFGINDSGSTATLSSVQINNNQNYGIIWFKSAGASLVLQGSNAISGNTPADEGIW